ncbi:hypothetical protein Q4577_02430 [Marinovum sp. 2_MG-2023]|uniref:hypothetical protein n=1 Tax=Roseobacteraceae TaxID=2854170 RepID=UPI001FD0978F|nr:MULTISPECIES: hypothetical protein [Roseobacteraceae]MCJ7874675.1 hypothetical protein [Phaeobacter sp. J2-8]MDO6728855.1 hypothetical protein [Marinovum sp. 2_MG-2023]MDO6777729.1 hypothetical protein [Marinovum sp. 1_MG-2023]
MEKKNTPLTAEQKTRRRVARTIARNFWRVEFKAANPGASKEELNAAWKSARKASTKAGRAAIRALEKSGFTISAPPQKMAVEPAE